MWFRFGRKYPQFDFIFCNPARIGIDTMRNMTCKVALEQDAEYVLFVDDDVCVPFDGLQKLIDCNSDISAGNVLIRTPPFEYMFFRRVSDGGIRPFLDDEIYGFNSIGEAEDLVAVGCSFCLIRVSLLTKLRTPYFLTCGNCTEDVYFCLRAKEQVPELSIRVDLNVECGHIAWPEILTPKNRRRALEYWESCNGKLDTSVVPVVDKTNEETQKTMLEFTSIDADRHL
jgi:hypothetical protein